MQSCMETAPVITLHGLRDVAQILEMRGRPHNSHNHLRTCLGRASVSEHRPVRDKLRDNGMVMQKIK